MLSSMPATTLNGRTCQRCEKPASKKCSRCSTVWYCSTDCQKSDWKKHKPICNSEFKMHQYDLHKKAFDTIIEKYNLKTDEKSTEIAELLTSGENSVTPQAFAERFGMDMEEAVVFLEWIKVGVKFREQTADMATKSGFGGIGKSAKR